ncbi:hypothetical protein [Vallitalea sp.]|jgi:hypothetical protein|uniref:hypothetical protein n=1 Tax=Vallitalea sp. TaxID=1882829 RepID=UPI0025E0D55A|nr:hypothetical protein [Vallitalea sp.]MCT4688255.1 hypothetical protein [Vallitalea sp.]
MSIRPLDMQVMLPKTQEIANIKHLDQQKANINQHNIAHSMNSKVENETKNVVKSNENEKAYSRSDAKEKGNNKYQNNKKKKDNKKEGSNKGKKNYVGRTKIDIRI